MVYITYAEYQSMGGSVEASAFTLLEAEARARVDRYTFGRVAAEYDRSVPYLSDLKSAMFAAIELLRNRDASGKDVSSMSNNGISVTYSQNASIESSVYDTVRLFLERHKNADGVPLCYVGVS